MSEWAILTLGFNHIHLSFQNKNHTKIKVIIFCQVMRFEVVNKILTKAHGEKITNLGERKIGGNCY